MAILRWIGEVAFEGEVAHFGREARRKSAGVEACDARDAALSSDGRAIQLLDGVAERSYRSHARDDDTAAWRSHRCGLETTVTERGVRGSYSLAPDTYRSARS